MMPPADYADAAPAMPPEPSRRRRAAAADIADASLTSMPTHITITPEWEPIHRLSPGSAHLPA